MRVFFALILAVTIYFTRNRKASKNEGSSNIYL